MHSCEPLPAALASAPASGPALLRQLGRLIVRARSPADRLQAKLRAAHPSTSQVASQQKVEPSEPTPGIEAQLDSHVQALWNEQIPVCIEVLLAPECQECCAALTRDDDLAYDAHHAQQRALLLERWTMRALVNKSHEAPGFSSSQWLLNAVRSQLHFSQLAAWRARLKRTLPDEDPGQRRRKLSRETCNYKKLEANCDDAELPSDERKLNVVYSIKIPGESYKMAEFSRTPTDHHFPVTNIGSNLYLKVVLESLPRTEDIPTVKCTCQPKRRVSKEVPLSAHEELVGKLNDLTLGPRCSKYSEFAINSNIGTSSRRLSIVSNPGSTEYVYTSNPESDKSKILDDRMLTPCSESGKHKCNCDEESDGNHRSSISVSPVETKKLDERRLKEIAKYKRRMRKESKLKKHCDSTSSEGELKTTHTSIPILQASRFDRFRAIGCYRNQTYLTLPASRIESKSPFIETESLPPSEFRKSNTVSTQTEDMSCQCGTLLQMKCASCDRGMVRSEANYNLASVDKENGARRKCEEDDKKLKKHKCDNPSSNTTCDIDSLVDSSVSDKPVDESIIKRPKLRRFFPIVGRIEKIVADRTQNDTEHREKDIEELNLRDDDTVFSVPKPDAKRQKTYSINEDYVLYENCDYGTFDKCDVDSPKEAVEQDGFKFPEPKSENQVPSPTEMDRFRWRFDSATSMVFHSKTGLPLTSSPAPLRRGNNCFDFDDSINGVSGIKSALFHPPASCEAPTTPRTPTPPPRKPEKPKLRVGSSTGLLGSFEESALKGRLEPVATVHGFTAELGASGAFCPPHRRLPVTVFFYAPGGTNAPYMGHINLGAGGYRVPRAGTVQVSLFNPHGTLVKMFVVLYELTHMPPRARTFLRQRTLYVPAAAPRAPPPDHHKWLRYLIHLRFMTSKSGKLYLHTDIRIIVSRKADLDTATAHSALFRPIQNSQEGEPQNEGEGSRTPNRVFGGCGDCDTEVKSDYSEIGYENSPGVPYELRSFTYAPDNPKYSPR
ncbi:atos homolog protein A isoform X2 [Battus philenor]